MPQGGPAVPNGRAGPPDTLYLLRPGPRFMQADRSSECRVPVVLPLQRVLPAFNPGNASVGTPLLRRSQRSPLSPAWHDLSNPTRVLWSLPAPRRAPPNLTPRPLCLVGCHAVASRQGEGAATWAGEPGCCSQRGAERGPTSPPRGRRQGWIGSPRIPMLRGPVSRVTNVPDTWVTLCCLEYRWC